MRSREYKIIMLGSGGVGKSSLTVRYIHKTFVSMYDPTIEDSYKVQATVDGQRVSLEIVDTAGTEQYMSLHSLYMKSGDAFALIFSLTSIDSVNELTAVRQQILKVKDAEGLTEKDIPLVLVGNKADLLEERQVPRELGITLSNMWSSPYFESSARNNINVTEIYDDLVRQLLRRELRGGSFSPSASPTNKRGSSSSKKKSRCIII